MDFWKCEINWCIGDIHQPAKYCALLFSGCKWSNGHIFTVLFWFLINDWWVTFLIFRIEYATAFPKTVHHHHQQPRGHSSRERGKSERLDPWLCSPKQNMRRLSILQTRISLTSSDQGFYTFNISSTYVSRKFSDMFHKNGLIRFNFSFNFATSTTK